MLKHAVILFHLLVVCTYAEQTEKPYERAFMVNGFGLRTAVGLGMLSEYVKADKGPNIVPGTCGGAFVAAIVHSSPNPDDWKKMVESREFFEGMKKLSMKDGVETAEMTDTVLQILRRQEVELKILGFARKFTPTEEDIASRNKKPPLFSKSLFEFPTGKAFPMLPKTFQNRGIRIVIPATEVLYTEDQEGEEIGKGEKLFRVVYFTDSETKKHLEGMLSARHADNPNGRITQDVAILDNYPLAEVLGAAISDPYYLSPRKISPIEGSSDKDRYFMGGVIDLQPLEMATRISNKRDSSFCLPDPLTQAWIKDAFGTDLTKTAKNLQCEGACETLVDVSSIYGLFFKTIEPRPNPGALISSKIKPINYNLPSMTYEEYLEITRMQWAYGERLARKALKPTLPRGDGKKADRHQ